uniref:Diacylglycerol kinase n=1 Tax=Haemonchus placei TaxID=6290 RepID=A0A0N4W6Z1_HAEPC
LVVDCLQITPFGITIRQLSFRVQDVLHCDLIIVVGGENIQHNFVIPGRHRQTLNGVEGTPSEARPEERKFCRVI